MPKLLKQIEGLLCQGTENVAVDDKLWELYQKVETIMHSCPEWDTLAQERKEYVILMILLCVETIDNYQLH